MDVSQPSPPVSPAGDSNDAYTVIIRGEHFQLSHNQIDFDAPNFFSTCFSSGFTESIKRTVTLDRNPALFALIIEYLSGYPILPLSAESIPPLMGLAMARRCLLADAQFYGLQRLSALLATPALNLDVSWMGYANAAVDLRDVIGGTLPRGIVQQPDGSVVSAENGLPAIAFVHNVILTIIYTRLVSGEKSYEADVSARAILLKVAFRSDNPTNICLSVPAGIADAPSSMAYREETRLHIAQRRAYWGLAGDRHIRESGALSIDGMRDNLNSIYSQPFPVHGLEFFQLPTHFRHYDLGTRIWRTACDPASQQRGAKLEHRSFTFWADQLLCRIIPRAQSNSPMEAEAWVEIVKADLRTRQHFLENLHIDPAERDSLDA